MSAEALSDHESLQQKWRDNGYCIAPKLLTSPEISELRDAARRLAVATSGQDYVGKKIPGELMSHQDLRWLIVDPRILGLARELLGPEVVYFGDSKVSVLDNRGKFHMDNGRRGPWPTGPGYDPFDPEEGPYTVVRFMIYLQDHQRFAGNLRVRTGSHNDPTPKLTVLPRDALYWAMGRLKTAPRPPRGKRRNMNTSLGDVVAFNLRTTHSVNAIRLAGRPELCLDPTIERFVPGRLRAPETERFAIQLTFAAPGVHLDRFIESRKRPQFRVRYQGSTLDSAETAELAARVRLTLRTDLIEHARDHASGERTS